MDGKKQLEHAALLILALLSGEDMYGYQMITELERRSDNTFRMKEGTLYPVLKKLENAGCVKSCQQETNGRVRKYYHITERGLSKLKTEHAEWCEYVHGVDAVLGNTMVLA